MALKPEIELLSSSSSGTDISDTKDFCRPKFSEFFSAPSKNICEAFLLASYWVSGGRLRSLLRARRSLRSSAMSMQISFSRASMSTRPTAFACCFSSRLKNGVLLIYFCRDFDSWFLFPIIINTPSLRVLVNKRVLMGCMKYYKARAQ